jgi:hypothetical protein
MSSDPRDYKYGDLNPGVTSTPARQDSLVIDRNTGLGTIARTINSVYESNNLQGLTRFKGIVLRDETDAQEQGFIDAVYKVLGDNTTLNIAAYKVRIPEVHILPVPDKVSSATGANVEQDPGAHQAIIDMYILLLSPQPLKRKQPSQEILFGLLSRTSRKELDPFI